MNLQGPTTWADFRHEAGWSLEERYPREAKYERKQYSIIGSEDISVYSVIFSVCSWVKVQPLGGLPPHTTNTTKASCIAGTIDFTPPAWFLPQKYNFKFKNSPSERDSLLNCKL